MRREMMKKRILTVLACGLLLSGCTKASDIAKQAGEETETAEPVTLTITNPVDLVVLEEHPDMSGYQWLDDSDPAFERISLKESIRMYKEGGSGIVYYGRANCPWCQRAVPVLNEAAKEEGITVYYVDVDSAMDNEGVILLNSEEGREVYDDLVSCIVSTFTQKDEEGNPSFQIPLVISVKNGEIQGSHLSLVDDFTLTDANAQMDEVQHDELKAIYEDLMEKAAD